MRAPVPVVVGVLFVVAFIVVNLTPLRETLISLTPSSSTQRRIPPEPIRVQQLTPEQEAVALARREATARREAAARDERQRQRAAELDARTVTAAEYRELRDGMTYREAVAVIGFPGVELSRTSIAGYTTVMFQWTNPAPAISNMNAMFQNDELVSKAQFGLR